MSEQDEGTNGYGSFWNRYVAETFPRIQEATPFSRRQVEPWRVLNIEDDSYAWPGDEWGGPAATARLLEEALLSRLDPDCRVLCELGAGSGRHTMLVLERLPAASVLSFDVSREFDEALRKRCQPHVASGRLRTYLLDQEPRRLMERIAEAGLLGAIDAVYSFDAMVHVDLHTLVVYWASASRMLRPGGLLSMSVADACGDRGAMKLFYDAASVYALRGNPGGHFSWISREIVESLLTRLGFEVSYPDGNGRDLFFCARLVDSTRAAAWFEKAGSAFLRR